MKKLFLSAALCASAMLQSNAQAVFRVELQHDTVGMNEYFEVKYVLENADLKHFTPPSFEPFQVVAGPSTFTSMSIINGKTTRSVAYSYHLKPTEIGTFVLGEAVAQTNEGTLKSSDLNIVVKEYFERRQNPYDMANPFTFRFEQSPFGEGNDMLRGNDFFGQDFFNMMPNMDNMMRQWEQFFQMPPNMQPRQQPKKEEKTYKL